MQIRVVGSALSCCDPGAVLPCRWRAPPAALRTLTARNYMLLREPMTRSLAVQFNSALGPYKGGLRFHPCGSALAPEMSAALLHAAAVPAPARVLLR